MSASKIAIGFMHVLAKLPLPMLRGLGKFIGRVLFVLAGQRRRIALPTLEMCFPDVPEARKLSAYHALIQQNLHASDAGQQLRAELDAHFLPSHPVMHECDRMIRLQAFKQKLPVPRGADAGAA